MFLGLPDPRPDQLVTNMDPDPSFFHKSVVQTEIIIAK
jgi:hypothetical protein